MTRKVTVHFELPEELCEVLAQQAAAEGRAPEAVLAEYWARHQPRRNHVDAQEAARRRAAFERHIGAWESAAGDSSDNEKIDRDLAAEYQRHAPGKG